MNQTSMTLTERQKCNWDFVLRYMEINPHDYSYEHSNYCVDRTVMTDDDGVCVCSFVFLSGFYGDNNIPDDGYPSNSCAEFNDELRQDFGDNVFTDIFNNDSEFYNKLYETHHIISTNPMDIAYNLREYLGISTNYAIKSEPTSIVMLVTKRGQRYNFPDVNALVQFIKLNPNVNKTMAKVIKTDKIPRIEYDEVTTDIGIGEITARLLKSR